MDALFFVGIGGFFGANARYLLTAWTDSLLMPRWGPFPFGTLAVNLLGSFGLAMFILWLGARAGLSPQLRLLVGTGFFGAFTTFSAFANDSLALLEEGGLGPFLLNVFLTNGLCLLGVMAGLAVTKRLLAA